jgi:5-hydroxyisourate hydrolase
MGKLTTHVLDTSAGMPAAGILVELHQPQSPAQLLASATTNEDGRLNSPLLEGAEFIAGEYELVFHAGDYFSITNQFNSENQFLNRVVIRFEVANAKEHYHVPLLISPFSYTTYRGS